MHPFTNGKKIKVIRRHIIEIIAVLFGNLMTSPKVTRQLSTEKFSIPSKINNFLKYKNTFTAIKGISEERAQAE
ncbi:MAG: hypothetical protein COW15_10450 [Shewanella sp. CG12_big_fil_rev_8_21_14_0_65_47_15]|nr:MAG: hypothetical protein COW15_10450 [Shewanella sp. CG12_big_fil_rev_8_21_14_0_65_47_15]